MLTQLELQIGPNLFRKLLSQLIPILDPSVTSQVTPCTSSHFERNPRHPNYFSCMYLNMIMMHAILYLWQATSVFKIILQK